MELQTGSAEMGIADRRCWEGFVWAGVVLLICGCSGPEGPERAVTFGAVQFDGEPVANGQIWFIPDHGPTAGGPIRGGKYRIDSKGGVPVGRCKVQIESHVPTGEEVVVGADGQKEQVTEQVLPPKFNEKTTLSVEIEAGRENQHDFDLQS
jgi:hypothetical protein